MESPKDHSTVIKAADINGIQNTAIGMPIRAFVKVRRRRIRYTTPQPMLGLQLECFGLQPLSKGFPKQIATQDRIPFLERLRGSVLKPTLSFITVVKVCSGALFSKVPKRFRCFLNFCSSRYLINTFNLFNTFSNKY